MMSKSVKLCVTFLPGTIVNFSSLLLEIKKKYAIGFACERIFGEKHLYYFQGDNSKLYINVIEKICRKYGEIDEISIFDTAFRGVLLLTHGTFKSKNCPRQKNDCHNYKNNHKNIFDPFIIGNEDISCITVEDIVNISTKYMPGDIPTPRIDILLAFATLVYELPENMNIKASPKNGIFHIFNGSRWDTKSTSQYFSTFVAQTWTDCFQRWIDKYKGELPIDKEVAIRQTIFSIRANSEEKEHNRDFHKYMKRDGLVVMENVNNKKRAAEIRYGNRIIIG